VPPPNGSSKQAGSKAGPKQISSFEHIEDHPGLSVTAPLFPPAPIRLRVQPTPQCSPSYLAERPSQLDTSDPGVPRSPMHLLEPRPPARKVPNARTQDLRVCSHAAHLPGIPLSSRNASSPGTNRYRHRRRWSPT
jgi:hypothetical protein